ncbi:MAG: hypothetical protein ACOCUL_04830 [Bacteroidota bacterium]
MKIIKNILFGILGVGILLFLVALFLPKSIKIERSIKINAPVDTVFQQVVYLKKHAKMVSLERL